MKHSSLSSRRICLWIASILALGTMLLPARADWGTLSDMHNYAQCFGLDSKPKNPAFKVTMLESSAPGNVFHEGEQPRFVFQIENLTTQPLAAKGKVEIIRYAQISFPGDQWYPDLNKLEAVGSQEIEVNLAGNAWVNLTIEPKTPETKGGYGMVVDLGAGRRAYLTSYVRTFKPSLERVQFPRQSLEEMPAPILERLGIQAIRWGVSYHKSGSPEYQRQWDRISRELREFHDHKVTVVAEVGAGNQIQPLGRGRPHLDENGFMKEGEKSDMVWLPEFDEDYQQFCYKLAAEFGWPKGPITGLKLWNEPWEGLSISGWGADVPRYRELFKRMGDAVFKARREAGVDVLIGGCDSSANTIDKLFADNWNDLLPYLDFCSIHYQGLSAPVLYPPWNNRKHYKGRVLIWDTESWVANTDDRFAGVVAANRAAGYDRSMGTLSRNAVSTLSHNRVEYDNIRVQEGKKRIERVIESRPLAAAYGASQHFIGERDFREILFTNGIPWVFTFAGLKDNADDGTVVVVGDLATLFEKGTPLFNSVRSLDEVRAKQELRRELAAIKPGDPRQGSLICKLNQPRPLVGGRLVIDAANSPCTLFDSYGNPMPARDGRIEVPLDEKGHFLRADPAVAGSFAKLLAAIRTARVEGLEPIEIIACDLTHPIDQTPLLRLRLTSQHNQPITGRLSVKLGELTVECPSELAFAPRQQKRLDVRVSGKARADNTYPLSVSFDAGPLGLAVHQEAMHVNWISHRTISVDGKLDDWSGAVPQTIITDAAAEQSFEEAMYTPFAKFTPGKAGGFAAGFMAYDADFFYFAARIADDTPHAGAPRFATRDEDADFYPPVSYSRKGGDVIEHKWPQRVRRFSYRRWPFVPSGMPQQSFDNLLLAFNAIPAEEKDWLTHLPGRMPRFVGYKSTDYEYALNKVADSFGGGTEIWRLLSPGMPNKHFFPRQPKHPLEGAVKDGKLEVRYQDGFRIVECALPWREIPDVKKRLDAGQTVKVNFRVNHDTRSPDMTLSMGRSAAEGISNSFHPNWIRQSPNELEFGFEK